MFQPLFMLKKQIYLIILFPINTMEPQHKEYDFAGF